MLTFVRYKTSGNYEVRLKDAAIATIPALIIAVSSGTVAKLTLSAIGFEYERFETAVIEASNLSVEKILEKRNIVFASDIISGIKDSTLFDLYKEKSEQLNEGKLDEKTSVTEYGVLHGWTTYVMSGSWFDPKEYNKFQNDKELNRIRELVSGRDLVVRIGSGDVYSDDKEKFYFGIIVSELQKGSEDHPSGNDVVFVDSDDSFVGACRSSAFFACHPFIINCQTDEVVFEKMNSRYETIQLLRDKNDGEHKCELADVALAKSETIGDAISIMEENNLGAIPIVGQKGEYLGRAEGVTAVNRAVLELLRSVR